MKVAVFSTTYFPRTGGAERFVHGLSSHLVQKGHDVVVIAPVSGELSEFKPNYRLCPLRFLGPFQKSDFLYRAALLLNLILIYRREHFNVLQVVGMYPAGAVGAVLKRLLPSLKLVGRATGSDIQTFPEINYGRRLDCRIDLRIRRSLSAFDVLVANSQSMQKIFFELGARPEQVKIIPNALDLKRFEMSAEAVRKTRQYWCHDPEAKIILTVGRNEERKNFPFLLEALESAFPQVDEHTVMVFVGEGTEKLSGLVTSSPYKDRYFFLGRLPKESAVDYDHYPPKELIELFCASYVFTLPSKIEGQPNVLLEALAAGLPTVAGDVPGSRDVVQNGETGMLVDLDKPDEFSEALVKLLNDSPLRERMATQAQEVARKYNWERVVKEYLSLYGLYGSSDPS